MKTVTLHGGPQDGLKVSIYQGTKVLVPRRIETASGLILVQDVYCQCPEDKKFKYQPPKK